MPDRRPIESAEAVLEELVRSRQGSRDHLPIGDLADVIRDFRAVEFDVPDSADSDGILFQYGRASWLPTPMFVFGFIRQFEVVDADGDHDCYSQVGVEYQYSLTDSLQRLEGREAWWFKGSDDSFEAWLEEKLADPIWGELRESEIAGVSVSQEIV